MGSAVFLFALLLLNPGGAQAGDANCRNSEKCFTLGVTDLTVNPGLQHTIGSWPFPRLAKVKTYVGAQLHFEWDARYEFYSKGAKEWVKKDAGLRTIWETVDGSKDPCAETPSRPWVAQGQTGRHDEVIQDCAKGRTYRVRLISDTIRPKKPEAILEITVLAGSPPKRVPSSSQEEQEDQGEAEAKPVDAQTSTIKPSESKASGSKTEESKRGEGKAKNPAQPEVPETKSILKALDDLL